MTDSRRLRDLSVAEFARRLASDEPAPGGGSAAALSAALGASLLSMVTGLTAGRPAAAEHQDDLRGISLGASTALSDLLSLVEADAIAYEEVVRARRLPRDGDRAERLRATALRAAVADATRIPLRTAQRAADLLALAERLARVANRNVSSDVAIAADLAWTGLRGGLANVRANLPLLPPGDPLPAKLAAEIDELEAAASRGVERVTAALEAGAVDRPRGRAPAAERLDEEHGSAALAAANEPTA